MDKVEEYIAIGKKLGLEGSELKDYVSNREEKEIARELERERDAKAREDRNSEKELARELERERDAKAREDRNLEREIKRLDIERMEKEKALELSLLEKEIELEKARKGGVVPAVAKKEPDVKARLPKLPAFNEKQDSMDAYLKRFERFADHAGWGTDQWATHLSALLQGKALDVYSRLSVADSLNYDALKEALLQRFQLTEEGFRSKFRSSKPETGETPQQFVVRLEDYLLRWMSLAKVPASYDGLKDLVLREQFMQVSSKNLQIFLKEHKVKSVREMTDLAQQYQEAHECSNRQNVQGRVINQTMTDDTANKPNVPQPNERDRVCYNCRSPSHFIRDCPEPKERNKVKAGALRETNSYRGKGRYNGRGRSSGYSGGYSDRNDQYGNGAMGQGTSQGEETVFANLIVESSLDNCCLEKDAVTLVCGDKLPVMTAACRDKGEREVVKNMPVVVGLINGQQVDVLRDSGCSGAVVRRSLVDEECLTGKTQVCILVDGTIRKFPVANICVDTPFFSGQVEALCVERPVYDLVIGNIPDVRDASDPDLSWKPSMHLTTNDLVNRVEETGAQENMFEFSGAVETRAQKAKEGKQTYLQVANYLSNVSVTELEEAPEADKSLGEARLSKDKGESVRNPIELGKVVAANAEINDSNGACREGEVGEACVAVIEELGDEINEEVSNAYVDVMVELDVEVYKEKVSENEGQSRSENNCRYQMTTSQPSLVAKETVDDVNINPELTDFTMEGSPYKIVWILQLDKFIRTLIAVVVISFILWFPVFDRLFIPRADIYDVGLRAVLLQKQEGTTFPVIYVSGKLLQGKKSYSDIEREGIGVICAVNKSRVLLYQCDHVFLYGCVQIPNCLD